MKYTIFIGIFILTFILMVSAIFTAIILGFGYNLAQMANIKDVSMLDSAKNTDIIILTIATIVLVIITYIHLAFSVRRKT